MPSVFLLGSTGYIGGSLLVALKKEHPDLQITALVRSESDFDAIRKAGAIPIQGTFQDLDKIADLSANADVIINTGDNDDVEFTNAILRGLKARGDAGKPVGVLIHTSGGMIYLDDTTSGKFDPNAKIWTDNEDDVRSLTTSMLHGQVDVPILKAGEEGYVYTYIINPSAVYGPTFGPLVRHSGPIKLVAGVFIQQKQAFYVGEGSSIVETIHINDLIDLYLRIFKLAVAGPPASNSYERYFIATSGRHEYREVASAIGKTLHKLGCIDSPEPKSIGFEEAGPIGRYMAANTACRPGRVFTLGWVPKEESYLEVISRDVESFVSASL